MIRSQFRKSVIKESLILLIFIGMSATLILQRRAVETYLGEKQFYVFLSASFDQGLAVIGLDPSEINAILRLEEFKQNFPQFSEMPYKETVGLYLTEHPDYLDRDGLYEKVGSAQAKIAAARTLLAKQRRLDIFSEILKKLGFFILIAYPFYLGVKFYKKSRLPRKITPTATIVD